MALARFIPACAGNSQTPIGFQPVWPVHPRVCGEQLLFDYNSLFVVGSSPRVRGTGEPCDLRDPRDRFIPACAGNRSAARSSRDVNTVHPRVCGEQTFHKILFFNKFTSIEKLTNCIPMYTARFMHFFPCLLAAQS